MTDSKKDIGGLHDQLWGTTGETFYPGGRGQISRLYFGIMDESLRQNVKFCYRQKSFTSGAGTVNNVALLSQVSRNMKEDKGGGDPMSPFLFNGIVDPLLTYLDDRGWGTTVRTREVAVLAFADDLTLVSETAEDILKTLGYFKALGMNLCCRRVREVCQVKPQQRLELIKTYIHPKFRYSLVLDLPSETTLREADNEIRQVICRMFHLPDSTTNHLFYSRTKDGGLGYSKLERNILFGVLKSRASMARPSHQRARGELKLRGGGQK
ncbi:hypothetical protein JTB14_016132 [Gonioctena quinquepunctata]|nr:hypothetical protein JTB14_016132 [Gonioctena quinquepunctata]